MTTRNTMGAERKGRPGAAVRRVQGGDERGGYEILVDKADRVVHMRLWGVWHLPVANEFYANVAEIGAPFVGKSWAIVADSKLFAAQSPEVSRLRQEAMVKARALGCDKIAAVADKVIYAMQFKRIAEESHVGGAVFSDEESALDWIHEERKRSK